MSADAHDLSDVKRVALTQLRRLRKYLEASGITPGATNPNPTFKRTNTMSSRDPKPLADLLEEFTVQADLSTQLAVSGLTLRWADIVGEEIADHVTIESFDEESGCLTMATDSTAWATQIRMLVPQIAARIDAEIGAGLVKDIVVNPPKSPSWQHGSRRVPGRGPRDTYG